MAKKKIIMEVTSEQEERIVNFISENNWNIPVNVREEDHGTDAGVTSGAQHDRHHPMKRHFDNMEECPFCFCSPCITSDSKKQQWWPDRNSPPDVTNTCMRKDVYQRFWGMLYNCGAWKDPRYLQKKVAARHGDTTWHRREIMPTCVLKRCREWYPNPPKQPYMGHKWN